MLGTPPALILSQDQTLKFNSLERAFDCLLFSYFVLLLSCVARCYHRTADTRRAGFLRRFRPERLHPCKVCTFYLVFKEPRTLAYSQFPPQTRHLRLIQSLGFCSGPFWGNLTSLRRPFFPSQPFFRYWRKNLQETFFGQRDALDREHRVNRVL